MSTDHTVTIHVAAEAVTRLVSNNSPALAARLALADFEGEFGRLPPGSYVEVTWQADDEGKSGGQRFIDLDAVRTALPGAEPAPSATTADSPFKVWWKGGSVILRGYEPHEDLAEEAWAAALAWAAGRAEAAGCACKTHCLDPEWDEPGGRLEDGRTVAVHDPRCPKALAAAIRAGRP
jgi:hypothetical protein